VSRLTVAEGTVVVTGVGEKLLEAEDELFWARIGEISARPVSRASAMMLGLVK
jgi:hypothetical protein